MIIPIPLPPPLCMISTLDDVIICRILGNLHPLELFTKISPLCSRFHNLFTPNSFLWNSIIDEDYIIEYGDKGDFSKCVTFTKSVLTTRRAWKKVKDLFSSSPIAETMSSTQLQRKVQSHYSGRELGNFKLPLLLRLFLKERAGINGLTWRAKIGMCTVFGANNISLYGNSFVVNGSLWTQVASEGINWSIAICCNTNDIHYGKVMKYNYSKTTADNRLECVTDRNWSEWLQHVWEKNIYITTTSVTQMMKVM